MRASIFLLILLAPLVLAGSVQELGADRLLLVFESTSPGAQETFLFTEENTLRTIVFETTDSVQGTSAVVTRLNLTNPPPLMSVYESYGLVNATITPDQVSNMTVTFRVNESWLEQENTTSQDIVVTQPAQNRWVTITPTYDQGVYNATLQRVGLFVIGHYPPPPTPQELGLTNQTTPTATPQEPPQTTPRSKQGVTQWLMLLAVALFVVTTALFFIRRHHQKNTQEAFMTHVTTAQEALRKDKHENARSAYRKALDVFTRIKDDEDEQWSEHAHKQLNKLYEQLH